ncbi:hypothetical protein L9F63_021245, partial [Diploptera punctata]
PKQKLTLRPKSGLMSSRSLYSELTYGLLEVLSRWILEARISNDCHSYNVIVKKGRGINKVKCQTVKTIRNGEELRIWFSEELLVSLTIPFLSPINIQGEKKYVCHSCKEQFEYPNPLKIHLALNCDQLKKQHLWSRLEMDTRPSFPRYTSTASTEGFSVRSEDSQIVSSQDQNERHDVKPMLESLDIRTSAFKPYMNKLSLSSSIRTQGSHSKIEKPVSSSTLPNPTTDTRTDHHHAAEMETLVSNLGRSKQGHLCIYCGKIYSRKYGLKIHIRTHTGYKPLKCKFCMRPFGDPSNLNKHVRLHAEGDTPYRCNLCGKILVRRRDLERHIKSRHFAQIETQNKKKLT